MNKPEKASTGPDIPENDKKPSSRPKAKSPKEKDDLRVTIGPGVDSTTDVDITPRH